MGTEEDGGKEEEKENGDGGKEKSNSSSTAQCACFFRGGFMVLSCSKEAQGFFIKTFQLYRFVFFHINAASWKGDTNTDFSDFRHNFKFYILLNLQKFGPRCCLSETVDHYVQRRIIEVRKVDQPKVLSDPIVFS
jgi:hypothetical protein